MSDSTLTKTEEADVIRTKIKQVDASILSQCIEMRVAVRLKDEKMQADVKKALERLETIRDEYITALKETEAKISAPDKSAPKETEK